MQLRKELIRSLGGERISWVDPALFHVTLRFLGDTPADRVPEITHALEEHVTLPQKSDMILSGPGSFGQRNKPRVIWLGFKEPGLFAALKEQVDRALVIAGIPGQGNIFSAHLTLARIRGLSDVERFLEILEEQKQQFSERVRIDRMVFFRSFLGNGPPRYVPLSIHLFRG